MSATRDVIGERGERIGYLQLTDFIPPGEPMFRPHVYLDEDMRRLVASHAPLCSSRVDMGSIAIAADVPRPGAPSAAPPEGKL